MNTQPDLVVLDEKTTGGNYFVSNYPPYSFWNREHVAEAHAALDRPAAPGTPLGVYLHIPFCRKRCHFCYFKVYTGKNADEVEGYLDAVIAELTLYSSKPFIAGRKPSFVYFGGGTPSYISSSQLQRLTSAMKQLLPWDAAREIAFEGEPGTLTEGKLEVIRGLGITRLSLGVEHFNDGILQLNGRAHLSKEIYRTFNFARSVGFPQINIDLIAGMMGETDETWREAVRKTIELQPDSITCYQMEVPFNTTIFKEMRERGEKVAPVAPWQVKRGWHAYAFEEFEKAGYTVTSAYTVVRDPGASNFVYRDLLWRGADMIGLGVASFSHIGGTHFQNEHDWDPYLRRVHAGEFPIARALTPTPEERMLREFVLQMKLGRVSRAYFRDKFSTDLDKRFATQFAELGARGYLSNDGDFVRLNRDGLMQVDRLLSLFFLPEHQPRERVA